MRRKVRSALQHNPFSALLTVLAVGVHVCLATLPSKPCKLAVLVHTLCPPHVMCVCVCVWVVSVH